MMTPLPHVPDECVRIDDYWGGEEIPCSTQPQHHTPPLSGPGGIFAAWPTPSGICREPLPGDRRLYCSSTCMTAMLHRRKAQAKRDRVRWGRCAWCGVPSGATYCTRHRSSVRSAQRSWRERRLASGLCLKCEDPRVTARHCEPHRRQHNASIRERREARRKAGPSYGGSGPLHRKSQDLTDALTLSKLDVGPGAYFTVKPPWHL